MVNRTSRRGDRSGQRKLDKLRVIEALRQAAGIQTAAARMLHCSRGTLWRYLKENPDVRAELASISEEFLDLVEAQAVKLVQQGDSSMIRYILSTKGRSRGCGERRDVAADVPVDMAVESAGDRLLRQLIKLYGEAAVYRMARGLLGSPAQRKTPNGHADADDLDHDPSHD
jgi:hypothetical protein